MHEVVCIKTSEKMVRTTNTNFKRKKRSNTIIHVQIGLRSNIQSHY